ncbi:hypothetical protein [Jidongwangia harbinensis]|uniref:hypothetical protein n=1 Tax=Jidongwangia harbinensis TaxID=2878561 RepID=UPI001CD97520|nr:hypothetical protein [Jidongwangia harbinensis]MCA2211948.1 hypothetical protein [Jidongwangia harbinensis]
MPDRIGRVLRHLDAGPATLVTSSYTGATAIRAAAEAPYAFARLSQRLAEPGRMAALRAMAAADVSACEARTPEVGGLSTGRGRMSVRVSSIAG